MAGQWQDAVPVKVCEYFNKHFPRIELLAAENIWDKEGEQLKGKELVQAKARRKITATNTATGRPPGTRAWIANSLELNVAEHTVVAIADKTHIATGSYTPPQLKNIHVAR